MFHCLCIKMGLGTLNVEGANVDRRPGSKKTRRFPGLLERFRLCSARLSRIVGLRLWADAPARAFGN